MSRSPTIKRILQESAELASHPSPDFTASPLDTDLHEWHFTLRGPPAPSPFSRGIYHGRIVLPPSYPLKPPSFRFMTPTGRFEVNREICLSISGHHEETWQPAWGIRTALVAIRSFMDSEARGQVGGLEAGENVRRRLAGQSRGWRCGVCCGETNEEILREVEGSGGEGGKGGDGDGEKEAVPEELRLAYREDLTEGRAGKEGDDRPAGSDQRAMPPEVSITPAQQATPRPATQQSRQSQPQPPPQVRQIQQPRPTAAPQSSQAAAVSPWIDKAIWGIVVALVILLWRKLIL